MVSTRDIKAIDPVTGDTVWDEPPATMNNRVKMPVEFYQFKTAGVDRPNGCTARFDSEADCLAFMEWIKSLTDPQPDSMSPYDELEFLQDLSNEVANAQKSRDSLGSTPGSVMIFPTYKKRDAIVRALEKRAADLRDQIQRTDR